MSAWAIFGCGHVGTALREALATSGASIAAYDPATAPDGLDAALSASVWWACVPTPAGPSGLELTAVMDVMARASRAPSDPLVLIKSTLPPVCAGALTDARGSTRWAYVPEFLVERDPRTALHPSRIVIGLSDRGRASEVHFVVDAVRAWTGVPRLTVSVVEAALIKLGSNTMLAARVALANELSEICAAFGASYELVRAGIAADPRIGPAHLAVPGPDGKPGFGGNCLPKDLRCLELAAGGLPVDVIRGTSVSNARRRVP